MKIYAQHTLAERLISPERQAGCKWPFSNSTTAWNECRPDAAKRACCPLPDLPRIHFGLSDSSESGGMCSTQALYNYNVSSVMKQLSCRNAGKSHRGSIDHITNSEMKHVHQTPRNHWGMKSRYCCQRAWMHVNWFLHDTRPSFANTKLNRKDRGLGQIYLQDKIT